VSVKTDLSASLEDYLEAIFHIVAKKQAARAKDIAERIGVRSSSVTGALRALAERELINYAPYDVITLSDEGTRLARDIVRRHEVLREFFVRVLGVDAAQAEDGACKMEHAIPRPIVDRFTQFLNFVETCPRGGSRWLEGFEQRCDRHGVDQDCDKCISLCLDQVRAELSGQEARGA